MAKKETAPTLDEILEYRKAFKESLGKGVPIDGSTQTVMIMEMTVRIFSVEMTDDVRETAWKYCKQLSKFSHAPVSPAEYKRMEKWVGEHGLIDVLLQACDGYYQNEKNPHEFDVVGFYYSIALLSQSQYRRADCLALLDRITQYQVKTKVDKYNVLLRNMTRLVKDFPDLAPLKTALESI